ncbi:MAG: PhnD/SsuA/transferrin family substrate-binding protein [Thauera sp.]|jgi:two-component system sensor histidine kinase TtrS|nr:PhnD/SsuA/transferrin family substrate-binding protein [Thauera sp.]
MPPLIRFFLAALALAASALSSATSPGKPVRVGVLAFLGADAAVEEWTPVLRRLQATLPGYTPELHQLDHAGLREAAQRGELDFVITNPGHYVELEASLGASRILTLDVGGERPPQRALGSAVIVPQASALQGLEDLRGRRLAIVGRGGFGGYQLVWGELDALGIEPEVDLAALHEVGFPMGGVVDAIDAGLADAGVLRSCLLEQHPDWAARFRVLSPRDEAGFPCATSTPLYPDWPLAALRHTPPELSRTVAIALLGMRAERDGLAWSVPADYQSVHALFRRLEIGPYAYLRAPTLMVLAERYWPWVGGFALLILGWILYTVRVEYLVQTRTAALRDALAAREAMEARMRGAQEQAEHLSRLSVLGELSGTLAHELNQPLAAIANYANSLVRRADNQRLTEAALREAAGEIAGQAERAAGILGRIRSFARKRTASREEVAPRELVDEAVTLFRGMLAHAPPVAVDDALPPGLHIEVDRLQIQQVLLNLLKNAWDASRGLPAERQRIDIRLETAAGSLHIRVRDYGSGLDETARAQLFESFFTTKADGLGLGLSICRSIAEAHGGRLAVATSDTATDTAPDAPPHDPANASADTALGAVGATFILSLPLSPSAHGAASIEAPSA